MLGKWQPGISHLHSAGQLPSFSKGKESLDIFWRAEHAADNNLPIYSREEATQTYVPLVARCFSAYRWKLRELDRQASFMCFICRQLKDFTNSVKKHHSHMLVCALSFYQVITHSIVKVLQQSNKKKIYISSQTTSVWYLSLDHCNLLILNSWKQLITPQIQLTKWWATSPSTTVTKYFAKLGTSSQGF